MCGICGLAPVDPRQPVDRAVLETMTAALEHRGPDGSGLHAGPGIGLGIRRLAIVDLDTGSQPIANEDGSVLVVCNGEIYNAPELRAELERRGHRFRTRSDVEVIVHLYEDLGVDLVTRLRGMFGLALWDAARRRLLLARDRLGIKPLVYAETPSALSFASEAKAILAGDGLDRAADVQAIGDLLDFGFVLSPRTLFSGIRRLPPGHLLLWQNGGATLRRYWRPPATAERSRRSAGEWAEALLAKLEETVRIHLRSDVEVGAWLSPGIDSSAVVALARAALGRPLRTVTLAFSDPRTDETRSSRTLADFPGFEMPNERATCDDGSFALLPEAVRHMEEPTAFAIEIPRLVLARASARRVKVVIAGEGADELLGGYAYFRWNRLAAGVTRLPLGLRRLALGPRLAVRHPWAVPLLLSPYGMGRDRYRRLVGAVPAGEGTRALTPELRRRLAEIPAGDGWPLSNERLRSQSAFAALAECEMQVRLPDFVLHTADRAAMACGLEVRVPFLDHELVELCAGIPESLKLRWLTEKYILRRAMAGVLPEEIRRRRKRGMLAPYVGWWRSPLPPFAAELLSERRLRAAGYFAPAAVAALLERHRSGREDLGHALNAVLGLQAWDETFVTRKGIRPTA